MRAPARCRCRRVSGGRQRLPGSRNRCGDGGGGARCRSSAGGAEKRTPAGGGRRRRRLGLGGCGPALATATKVVRAVLPLGRTPRLPKMRRREGGSQTPVLPRSGELGQRSPVAGGRRRPYCMYGRSSPRRQRGSRHLPLVVPNWFTPTREWRRLVTHVGRPRTFASRGSTFARSAGKAVGRDWGGYERAARRTRGGQEHSWQSRTTRVALLL